MSAAALADAEEPSRRKQDPNRQPFPRQVTQSTSVSAVHSGGCGSTNRAHYKGPTTLDLHLNSSVLRTKTEELYFNAPRQIVIAGSIEGMQKVLEEGRRHGARKAEFLHVPVLSHCPLLSSVADSLRLQINSMQLKAPKFPYIANVNAQAVRSASAVATDLADNIAHGVR